MTGLLRLVSIALVVLALAPAPGRAAAAKEQAALAVAERLANGAYAAMTTPGLAESERHARLRKVISETFAFDIWERFLVGDRSLSEKQLTEFRALLPGFLAKLYADQFGKGLAGRPVIKGTRRARRDILVKASFPRTSGGALPVEYRIRIFPDRGPLVIDVMVGGVSFLVLKRDEFHALLERDGPAGLLAFMRAHAV